MVCSIWKHIAVRKNGDGLANRPEHKVKRACFKWGLGRELYTAPFIWIRKQFCNLQQQGGKWTCYDHFRVQSMETDNGRITYLQIVNESTSCIAYEWRA